MYHVQLNIQASLRWGFFKSLQFIRHNMGITSQCYFKHISLDSRNNTVWIISKYKHVMAYLQVSQLGIHGEDSRWQLFDLVTIQVPSRRIYSESNVYIELV